MFYVKIITHFGNSFIDLDNNFWEGVVAAQFPLLSVGAVATLASHICFSSSLCNLVHLSSWVSPRFMFL